MPPAIQSIVHVAYGDATALTFLIAAFIAVVGVLAALALPKIRLRTTLDVTPAEATSAQK